MTDLLTKEKFTFRFKCINNTNKYSCFTANSFTVLYENRVERHKYLLDVQNA